MAERLNALQLAYANQQTNTSSNFDPRRVSFDVRTPEELAAVNEFLYTLNRNASARRSHPGHSDDYPQYFDSASLAQLGLTTIPGVPGSGTSFSDPGPYPHSYQHPGPIYPSVNHIFPYSQSHYTGQSGHMYSPATSSVSTPSPPHMSVTMPIPDSTSFGYLVEPRGPPPVPNLSPVNYHNSSIRDIIPLKSVPGPPPAPPGPVEPPKLQASLHRGPSVKLTPSSSVKRGSLYPSLALSLTEGDPKLKLPPLNYRSPSPASPRSLNSTLSRDTSPAPSHSHHAVTVLPSIHSIAPSRHVRRTSGSEDLTKKVAEINLDRNNGRMDPADHAKLIWQLFVAINLDYKKRIGTPPSVVKMEEDANMDLVGKGDVDMVAAC